MASLRKKLYEKNGDFTLDGAFKLLLSVALLVLFISVSGVLITWSKVNVLAGEITRYIELQGAVDSSVYARFDELAATANMDADIDITAEYLTGTSNIQFGGQFSVHITYESSFGMGGVVKVPITLEATATGRSEMYWRD